ncbi:MAG: hypothetical protein J0L52_12720 [Caulobacterales bacterium]|nr:hypothetical protein [Caulobacterales bacterium]
MQKKKRGRPIGSGKDDQQILDAIADRMVRTPNLPATTALRQLKPDASPAEVRRIQAKWKVRRTALLASATKRRTDRSTRTVSDMGSQSNSGSLIDAYYGQYSDCLSATDAIRDEMLRVDESVRALRDAAMGYDAHSQALRDAALGLGSGSAALREAALGNGLASIAENMNARNIFEATAGAHHFMAAQESTAMKAVRSYLDSPDARASLLASQSVLSQSLLSFYDSPTYRALEAREQILKSLGLCR